MGDYNVSELCIIYFLHNKFPIKNISYINNNHNVPKAVSFRKVDYC